MFQTPLVPTQIGFHNAAAVIRASGGGGVLGGSQGQSQSQSQASSLLGGLSATSASLTTSLAHSVPSVPSLIPATVTSSFPLLTPSRSLPSHSPHSPPLSLTGPPRPPSPHSPQSLVKERDSSRLLRAREFSGDLRDRERERERERELKQDKELVLPGEDASPPSSGSGEACGHPGAPTSPLQLTPVLVESQIQRIADTAAALVKSLPVAELEPKQPNAKKKICKELEVSLKLTAS